MFGYIPDAVHLGTTFVNAIANIMTTCAHNLDLTLTFPNGTEIEDVIVGGLRHTQDQYSTKIHLGDIRYGQDLDFLVVFKEGKQPSKYEALLTYTSQPKDD